MNKKKDNKEKKIPFFKRYLRVIPELKNEEDRENSNSFNLFEVVVIVFISVLFGFAVGCILSYTKNNFIGTEVSSEISEFVSTYNNILDNYYDDVDEKKLMDAAVSGMINSLDDPYSSFMDSSNTETFNETVDGEYVGIGVRVTLIDNKCVIDSFLTGSTAKKSGMKINDIITKVGKKDVTDYSLTDISKLIKGEKDTYVNITVLRDGSEKKFKVKRTTIELDSVITANFDGVGYIYIESFAANTSKQFNKALKQLEKENVKGLIIDVRGNPGGHLNQVNEVLDNFFNKKTVLYKIETKGKKTNVYSTGSTKRDINVAILTNSSSASAAEILASAFKENYDNATIVGTTTYGKGTIQNAIELSSGSSYKYTTQKWLTSKDEWINEKGIIPDVEINQSDEYNNNPSNDNDAQLQKAIEILKNETK